MKKIAILVLIMSVFSFFTTVYGEPSDRTPIGYWKTIDDVTGRTQSILKITEANNMLYGRIVKLFPAPGHDEHEVCKACKGAKHNQPILNMVIMEGLKQNAKTSNEWLDGEILDPRSGKTYHCILRLVDKGHKLNVRGYIGVPLFGRTQTWLRVDGLEG